MTSLRPLFLAAGFLAVAPLAGCRGDAVKPVADTATPVAPAADAPVLAVSALKAQGMPAGEAATVTDLIRKNLMATGRWRVIDRDATDQAIGAKALALATGASDAEAADFGKLLNARLIGVGTYGSLMGSGVVTFRIVDVESGLAAYAGTAQGANLDELTSSLAKMVRDFK